MPRSTANADKSDAESHEAIEKFFPTIVDLPPPEYITAASIADDLDGLSADERKQSKFLRSPRRALDSWPACIR
jgi:hypothetical protein